MDATINRHDLRELVDLDRYPIDALDTPVGIAFVERCRCEYDERGIVRLAGFFRNDAVHQTLASLAPLMDKLWRSDKDHNVYFTPVLDSPQGTRDARAIAHHTSQHSLAYDLMPPDLPLRRLYESEELLRFVAAILGVDELYRSADPLDACEIAVFTPGQELGWHFDNSAFSVTIMLQPAEAGGAFDYVRHLRAPGNGNEAGVADYLRGADNKTPIRLEPTAGMFSLFAGRYALHRVTPIEGEGNRVNSVLTYADRPGVVINELTRMMFYGRLG